MKKLNFLLFLLLILYLISCKKETPTPTIQKPNSINNQVKATDTLRWYNNLCDIQSTFDSSKYKKKQLQDTFELWFSTSTFIEFDGYPVFDLDKKLMPISDLETKYLNQKQQIENLEIVDNAFWKNIKKLKLIELKGLYDRKKTNYLAYRNPAILIQTDYDPKAEIYVSALVSSDSLQMITAWRQLKVEQKKQNGSPEDLEKIFQSRLNSPRALEYAKMELFSFGWNNNIINYCKDCEILQRTDLLENEFKKLFVTSTEDCDEP